MSVVGLAAGGILSLCFLVTTAGAEEPGRIAAGIRYDFVMPSAKFDRRLSNGGDSFDNDYKPEIFIVIYPMQSLSLEYSFIMSEHSFSFGSPIAEIGATRLFTQSLTAKLHPLAGNSFDPYVGGGMNIVSPYETSSTVTGFSIDDHVGWMAQAGINMRMSQNSWFNIDYRYLEMDTHARLNGTSYRFDISPHVFGVGVKYRM